jgi:hypothetical protein
MYQTCTENFILYPVYSSRINKNIRKLLKHKSVNAFHICPLLQNIMSAPMHPTMLNWDTDSRQQSSHWKPMICCSRNSPCFIEPENLLACSHHPATGPYPEPVKSNTHSPTLFLERYILTLSSYLHTRSLNFLFPSSLPTKILYLFFISMNAT